MWSEKINTTMILHVTAHIGRRRNRSVVTGVTSIRRPVLDVKYSSTQSGQSAYNTSRYGTKSPPLLTLDQVRLGFINTDKPQTPPITLDIQHPTQGGHVIVGPNGSCKSLLGMVLSMASTNPTATTNTSNTITTPSEYIQQGSIQVVNDDTRSHFVSKHSHQTFTAHVSFQSHQDLLQRGGTVWHAISSSSAVSLPPDNATATDSTTSSTHSSSGGNLSKAAQFLVVRWGLYPLLHQDVRTLSTGQIRKVLLVSALAKRPKLLILDNAFDGLDGPSRNALRELVSKTLRGFRQDILVQAVDSKATAHTQVVLITHRAEEIVDECQTITYMMRSPHTPQPHPQQQQQEQRLHSPDVPTRSMDTHHNHNNNIITDEDVIRTESRNGQSGDEILRKALLMQAQGDDTQFSTNMDWENDDPTLPSHHDISTWWTMERSAIEKHPEQPPIIVQMSHLSIGQGDATLLHELNWTVTAGDHWLVAGGNGAGKSTLSRFLARGTGSLPSSTSSLLTPSSGTMILNTTANWSNSSSTDTIGWVATELHIAMSRSPRMVRDVVTSDGKVAIDVATFVTRNLNLNDQLMDRQFLQLSQGEQKLVLIASAIALRPQLLVLDEPCQGLDLLNRRRVLGLVERLCQATDMNLVYITHHWEEWIPSMTHVLHLVNGKAVYNGERSHYDPDAF